VPVKPETVREIDFLFRDNGAWSSWSSWLQNQNPD